MNEKEALQQLLKKYNIGFDSSLNLHPGWYFLKEELNEKDVPLLTWRSNRKFTELHNIVSTNTIKNTCMLRFCSFGNKWQWKLEALIYKELDLCEFLGKGKISSLHAVLSENLTGNVIVKLDNGIIGSIEVSLQVAHRKILIDRHEIIARRGVASDLVTDTQIPQSSIYTFTDEGNFSFKDIDYELYGFDELQTEYIRSAFEVYKNRELEKKLQKQHNHLSRLVDAVYESNLKQQKVEIK